MDLTLKSYFQARDLLKAVRVRDLFLILLVVSSSFLNADSCDGDCKDGKGIKLFSNGNRYEGNFKNGKFDGEGSLESPKGYKYSGQFKEGNKNGFGIWNSGLIGNKLTKEENNFLPAKETKDELGQKSIYYEGEWKNNKREGNGKLIIKKNGKTKKYSGFFINGKLNGRGMLETDFAKYIGVFKNNRLNGQGIFENKDGEKYVGGFINFKFDGKGTYTFKDKTLYIGDFKSGKFHGKGRLFSSKHKIIRSGKWEAGEFKK